MQAVAVCCSCINSWQALEAYLQLPASRHLHASPCWTSSCDQASSGTEPLISLPAEEELAALAPDAAAQHCRGCSRWTAWPGVARLLGLDPNGCWLLRRLDHHHHDVRMRSVQNVLLINPVCHPKHAIIGHCWFSSLQSPLECMCMLPVSSSKGS